MILRPKLPVIYIFLTAFYSSVWWGTWAEASAANNQVAGAQNVQIQVEPGFIGNNPRNVTVPEGRDVKLQCTVKNLRGHRVRIFSPRALKSVYSA